MVPMNKIFLNKVYLNILFLKGESCSECKKKISSEEPFYRGKNDHFYCIECYPKINSKSCACCKKVINVNEKAVKTLTFHDECLKCFKCHKCGEVFSNEQQVYSTNDQFSCIKCH